MGEVYRATDTKLSEGRHQGTTGRTRRDAERLARFQREAEVLAALNHPNIAAIHGLEEADGMTALVMELVEGRRWRIASHRERYLWMRRCRSRSRSPKRWKRLTSKGIVHRDLKPATSRSAGRQSEGAGLRARESVRGRRLEVPECIAIADDDSAATMTARNDSRNGSLHESRNRRGQGRRQAHRHLGLRLRAVRDVDGSGRSRVKTYPDIPARVEERAGLGSAAATVPAQVRQMLRCACGRTRRARRRQP